MIFLYAINESFFLKIQASPWTDFLSDHYGIFFYLQAYGESKDRV